MKNRYVAAFLLVPVSLPIGLAVMRHHVPVALSYVSGPEIMTSAKLVLGPTPTTDGVPPYVISEEEVEGTFAITEGDSFTVTTRRARPTTNVLRSGSGSNGDDDCDDDDDRRGRGRGRGNREETSRVTFRRSHFRDIGNAEPDEIIDAINAQLRNAEVYEDNGHLVLVADGTGERAVVELQNRRGAPLDVITLPVGPKTGETPMTLTLSIPAADDPNFAFAGDRYRIVVSTTAGNSQVDGITVPLQVDGTTVAFDALIAAGQLPGFTGTLNGNDDSTATLAPASARTALGTSPATQLFLAFVVYDESNAPEYVSNLFTVDLAR